MNRTIKFDNPVIIKSVSSIGGPKECSGEVGKYIQTKLKDDTYGEKTYEKAETKMLYTAISNCIKNSNVPLEKVDVLIAGDLLNQIISATFSARNLNLGYLGAYNACATFTESLLMGSTFIDSGKFSNIVCATSSHFSTAERQYRYPLELGSIRPPQAQWTVTGAGACLISNKGIGPKITSATVGRVIDYGVVDVNNMGAVMAPAACDTIVTHLNELKVQPNYYDLIITGDLGALGTRLLKKIILEKGYDIDANHVDCGELIYNIKEDEYQGGSGAGCISLVFCSYLFNLLKTKKINKILLVATGALLSSLSCQQGESIPAIAHAVAIENI